MTPQCEYTKSNGKQCKSRAMHGHRFCGPHVDKTANEAEVIVTTETGGAECDGDHHEWIRDASWHPDGWHDQCAVCGLER